MTGRDLLERLGDIDPRYIREAEEVRAAPRRKGRWAVPLIAAILGLLLVGAGVVAAVNGSSIQSWLSHQWRDLTGTEAGEGQTALLDHLSQQIGAVDTVGEGTVIVDSAAVGEESFVLLVKVTGLTLTPDRSYGFEDTDLTLSPDPMDVSGGSGGYGVEYQGIDGDGTALFLVRYDHQSDGGETIALGDLEVTLTLTNFGRDMTGTENKTLLAEGTWTLTFSLRASQVEKITLPDTEVTLLDSEGQEIRGLLTDLEVSNTGIKFSFEDSDGGREFRETIFAVLKTGQTIPTGDGSGGYREGQWLASYQWAIPLNLADAAAVRLGEVEVLLP